VEVEEPREGLNRTFPPRNYDWSFTVAKKSDEVEEVFVAEGTTEEETSFTENHTEPIFP